MFPPLNPLRVFKVVASSGSFTEAAKELNVSQSAVSRQISVLEGYLGVQLFRRSRDGVHLTSAGASYQREISPALEIIEHATDALSSQYSANSLNLTVYNTFAAKWLMSRIPHLYADHPELNIHFTHSVKPIDFSRDASDVAIQFGNGDWAGAQSELLIPDMIQPVCSPGLVNGKRPPSGVEDLKKFKLLQSKYRSDDWQDWFDAAGERHHFHDNRVMFDSSLLAYQAAVDGLGVAIGQVRLLEADLSKGLLVPLFDTPVSRSLGYYVVWPGHRNRSVAVIKFIKWIRKEASQANSKMDLGKGLPIVAA